MSSDLLGLVVAGGGEEPRRGKRKEGRAKEGKSSRRDRDLEAAEEPEPEEEAPGPAPEAGPMSAFFADVSQIKALLEAIRKSLQALEAANDESKTATKAKRIADIRTRMEAHVEDVGKKAREAKARLERLEKGNEEARTKKGGSAGSSQDRTRSSITLSLHKKLRDLMGAFQELRGKLQNEYKEVVERRYFAIYGQKVRQPRRPAAAPPLTRPARRMSG
jgi:syntaxin 1B/2/3